MDPHEISFSKLSAEVKLAECGLTLARVRALTGQMKLAQVMRDISARHMLPVPSPEPPKRRRAHRFAPKQSKHRAAYEAVLSELDEASNIAELCRREGVNPVLFYRWRKRREGVGK